MSDTIVNENIYCSVCKEYRLPHEHVGNDEFLKALPAPLPAIEATLTTRNETYGLFEHQARITQQLKQAMHRSQNWPKLNDDMKESLEMIASKIARILNGDPSYSDSWHDIAGYARLIEKRLEQGDVK